MHGRSDLLVCQIGQTSTERRRGVSHAELGLDAKWTCRGFRDQLTVGGFQSVSFLVRLLAVFGRVGVRPFDLHKTLGADGLITASRPIQVRRIVEEADGTLCGIFVQIGLDALPVHVCIVWQLDLSRGRVIPTRRSGFQRSG